MLGGGHPGVNTFKVKYAYLSDKLVAILSWTHNEDRLDAKQAGPRNLRQGMWEGSLRWRMQGQW